MSWYGKDTPEWTERAAGFIDLYDVEAARWRIIRTEWGALGIRDPMPVRAEPPSIDTFPQAVTMVRMEFQSEIEARRYIRNVATEYALRDALRVSDEHRSGEDREAG